MAKFYGMLRGETSTDDTPRVTKMGRTGIQATAQSWEGSAQIRIFESKEGKLFAQLYTEAGSTGQPRNLLGTWPLDEFVKGGMLK